MKLFEGNVGAPAGIKLPVAAGRTISIRKIAFHLKTRTKCLKYKVKGREMWLYRTVKDNSLGIIRVAPLMRQTVNLKLCKYCD